MASEKDSQPPAEKKKENGTALEVGDTAWDVSFEKFSQDLGLPDEVKNRAWNVYRDFVSKQDDWKTAVSRTDWFSAAVYTASIDVRMPYGRADPHVQSQNLSAPCVCLTELLKKSHINVVEFFTRMRTLRESVVLSDAVKHCFTSLEKRYCIVSPLYHRFVREWETVFRMEEPNSGSDTTSSVPFSQTEGPAFRKTLCWTLFLHTKECLLGDGEELIQAYHLLLCCLEYILRNTPSFQLQQPFDMLRLKSTENLDQNGFNVAVLRKLAEQFQTSVEELYAVQTTTEGFFQGLKHTGTELDAVWLREQYLSRYRKAGDLDELLFLQNDSHLVPEHKVISVSTTCSTDAPVTPVRAALNTIQQLKNILSNSQDEPSEELMEYFENCAVNPLEAMKTRIGTLKSEFVKKFTSLAGVSQQSTANERFLLAVRLYYRVMKALLDTEKERLSLTDFSNLLNNDSFHRSLLACSAEIVLMTYGMSWNLSRGAMDTEDSKFAFPWVLEVFSLYSYDFYKVLESFIKAEPNLTREIIKHLTAIENRILDTEAWTEESPLFEAISKSEAVATGSPSRDLPNGHSSSAAELYLSPMRPQRNKTCVVLTSPRKQNPDRNISVLYSRDISSDSKSSPSNVDGFTSPRKHVIVAQDTSTDSPAKQSVSIVYSREGNPDRTGPRRSQSLNMFFNKVCKLGYHRLKALCDILQVPRAVQQKIWTCFEFCLTRRPDLMKNRHLDQILMCSVYAICKVCDNEIRFKDIVQGYRMLPHADPMVFKQALIEGSEYDSIISFYNRVFMQAMKNFILQFAKPVQPNLSPVPRPVSSPLSASPVYSIPGRRNFYVSPLRESPFKAPQSPSQMTPRTKQLYSFGEGLGSAEKLKNINESILAFRAKTSQNATTPRSLKRLSFDAPDDATQNSPSSSGDCDTIVVKKKRIDPPAVQLGTTSNSEESQDR